MGTTPSYGWVFPDPTDLVKDLPADFELFADAVDADLADLLGGTTGQVLSKASNSDHDFSWVNAAGMVQIATGTFTGSAINITGIAGTYKHLMLVTYQFTTSTTDKSLRMRFNADTGTNYDDEVWAATLDNQVTGDTSFGIHFYGTGTSRGNSVTFIPNYAQANIWKMALSDSLANDATTTANYDYRKRLGVWDGTAAITEINLIPESGTFSSGTYFLWGVN